MTLGDLLFTAYANLAMAHMAIVAGDARYGRKHYAVRARLLAGLRNGTMNVGSLLDDERLKMLLPSHCAYCGSSQSLTIDHVFPRARGGADDPDNAVWACRSCNSSKGKKDLLDWYGERGVRPPILLVRRYLKQSLAIARARGVVDTPVSELPDVPFSVKAIPLWYPDPLTWSLWIVPLDRDPARRPPPTG